MCDPLELSPSQYRTLFICIVDYQDIRSNVQVVLSTDIIMRKREEIRRLAYCFWEFIIVQDNTTSKEKT